MILILNRITEEYDDRRGGGGAQNIQVYNLTRMFEQDKYYIFP